MWLCPNTSTSVSGYSRAILASRPPDAARLVHDGEPQAAERHVSPLGQSATQLGTVVVAPAGDQSLRARLELVQQRRLHPVTGVHHDVGGRHLVPDAGREVPRALGHVGVGDQQ